MFVPVQPTLSVSLGFLDFTHRTTRINTSQEIRCRGEYIERKTDADHLVDEDFCESPVDIASAGLEDGMVVTVEPGM